MKLRIAVSVTLLLAACSLFSADTPAALKTRFVVGDPVWREVPIRADLQNHYESCWQTVLDTILDNHFGLLGGICG